MSISTDEIALLLASKGFPENVVFGDDSYVLRDTEWLNQTFAPAFLTLLETLGVNPKNETFDCDDYSRLCAAYADILGVNSIGEFWYESSIRGDHSICFMITEDRQVIFFEPQEDTKGGFKTLELTSTEISSAWFIRL